MAKSPTTKLKETRKEIKRLENLIKDAESEVAENPDKRPEMGLYKVPGVEPPTPREWMETLQKMLKMTKEAEQKLMSENGLA